MTDAKKDYVAPRWPLEQPNSVERFEAAIAALRADPRWPRRFWKNDSSAVVLIVLNAFFEKPDPQ